MVIDEVDTLLLPREFDGDRAFAIVCRFYESRFIDSEQIMTEKSSFTVDYSQLTIPRAATFALREKRLLFSFSNRSLFCIES